MKSNTKKLLALLLALAVCFTMFAGCTATPAAEPAEQKAEEKVEEKPAEKTEEAAAETPDTVKIGLVIPMTGGATYEGALSLEGYEFGVKYYNEVYGGIKSLGGAKLELFKGDHTGVADVGITETERLINDVGVDILCGTVSSTVMLAIEPTCDKYQTCIINQGASTSACQEQGSEYAFMPFTCAADNAMSMALLAEMIEAKTGGTYRKVALISENNEWGVSNGESVATCFEKEGFEVVFHDTFEIGSSDFSSMISKIKQADPDFVCPTISSFNDAVLFVNQLREYGCDAALLTAGGAMITTDFLQAVGENADGIFSTCGWTPDFLSDPKAIAIHDMFVEEYGHQMDEYQGLSFQSIALIVAALEEAGSLDKQVIHDTIYNMKLDKTSEFMMMCPFSKIVFDEMDYDIDGNEMTNKNVYATMPMAQYIDGNWRMVYPDDVIANNPLRWPAYVAK